MRGAIAMPSMRTDAIASATASARVNLIAIMVSLKRLVGMEIIALPGGIEA